ncbi:hypothetical protein GCM10022261_17810 [Brevibacterium daeguense]|uniref:Uncharacterized protein n=1 Tax=Brevibacterium daeguense TaxID=909936 RepID=A0ABP8EK36_9MICO
MFYISKTDGDREYPNGRIPEILPPGMSPPAGHLPAYRHRRRQGPGTDIGTRALVALILEAQP